MDKILEIIWWPMTLALIPLDGSVIIHYIYEEYFDANFWAMAVLYILLCASVGVRIHLIEKEGRK